MKVLLVLALFLVNNLSNGKPVQENGTIDLPQIKKLSFDLEEISSKENLQEITRILLNLNENSAQANSSFFVDTNAFLDGLLENLKTIIINSGMDPMALEDTALKLFPIGTTSLTSGWLQDTSTINRYDDVVTTYKTNTVSFLLPLNFKALMFTYKYNTRVLLLLNINGDVQGKIDDVKLNLEIGFNRETSTLSMGALSLRGSGKISVKFTGNGLVDWITNAMTSVITTVLKPILIRLVEAFVKSAGTDLIDAVNDYIHG